MTPLETATRAAYEERRNGPVAGLGVRWAAWDEMDPQSRAREIAAFRAGLEKLRAWDRMREYRHPRHAWCQPGDEPDRKFMLLFADPDRRSQYFDGPEAERLAWEAWDRFAPAWSCALFGVMDQGARPVTVIEACCALEDGKR